MARLQKLRKGYRQIKEEGKMNYFSRIAEKHKGEPFENKGNTNSIYFSIVLFISLLIPFIYYHVDEKKLEDDVKLYKEEEYIPKPKTGIMVIPIVLLLIILILFGFNSWNFNYTQKMDIIFFIFTIIILVLLFGICVILLDLIWKLTIFINYGIYLFMIIIFFIFFFIFNRKTFIEKYGILYPKQLYFRFDQFFYIIFIFIITFIVLDLIMYTRKEYDYLGNTHIHFDSFYPFPNWKIKKNNEIKKLSLFDDDTNKYVMKILKTNDDILKCQYNLISNSKGIDIILQINNKNEKINHYKFEKINNEFKPRTNINSEYNKKEESEESEERYKKDNYLIYKLDDSHKLSNNFFVNDKIVIKNKRGDKPLIRTIVDYNVTNNEITLSEKFSKNDSHLENNGKWNINNIWIDKIYNSDYDYLIFNSDKKFKINDSDIFKMYNYRNDYNKIFNKILILIPIVMIIYTICNYSVYLETGILKINNLSVNTIFISKILSKLILFLSYVFAIYIFANEYNDCGIKGLIKIMRIKLSIILNIGSMIFVFGFFPFLTTQLINNNISVDLLTISFFSFVCIIILIHVIIQILDLGEVNNYNDIKVKRILGILFSIIILLYTRFFGPFYDILCLKNIDIVFIQNNFIFTLLRIINDFVVGFHFGQIISNIHYFIGSDY